MKPQNFYKTIIQSIYEGVYLVDSERRILFWNKGAENMSGYTSEEVVGRYCMDNILNHIDEEGHHLCMDGCYLESTMQDGLVRDMCVYLHHKEGYRVPVSVRSIPIYEDGVIIGAVEVFQDDTANRQMLKSLEDFRYLALNDELTGLANRRYIDTFLDSKVNEFRTLGIPFAIAFIDIDHFRNFNNEYGHDTGDEVLKMVAKTFRSMVRNVDLTGRWGGEEFLAVFVGAGKDSLATIAEKIRGMVERSSIKKGDLILNVTVSIGITDFRAEDTIDTALKRADNLLYDAKAAGRNRVVVG
ncbi:MAG: diguanylate cyclase [Anaerofustis sp.]